MADVAISQMLETPACGLCGGNDTEILFTGSGDLSYVSGNDFGVVRCNSCGLLYTSPRPTREHIGRWYPPAYYHDKARPPLPVARGNFYRAYAYLHRLAGLRRGTEGLSRPWAGRVAHALLWLLGRDVRTSLWTKTGRLLDIGCGPGWPAWELQQRGWIVYGVDRDISALQFATSHLGLNVCQGDFQAGMFPSDTFDAITLNHVLEHFHDPLLALREVYRVLKPGGFLHLGVPNADSMEATLFGRWWFPWDLPRHLYHFSPRTLRSALARTGFHVETLRCDIAAKNLILNFRFMLANALGFRIPYSSLMTVAACPFAFVLGHLHLTSGILATARKPLAKPG